MKESDCKRYEDPPLFLNAATVAKLLGVSQSNCYELMHEPDFPVLKIGNRMVIPKEQFTRWGMACGRWKIRYGSGTYFSLPNEIFLLGLNAGELAVYSYLKRCEDRKTHQCWPNDWEVCGYE